MIYHIVVYHIKLQLRAILLKSFSNPDLARPSGREISFFRVKPSEIWIRDNKGRGNRTVTPALNVTEF